ncbi:MAG: metal ABC transporter ATP-binding protein [Desulfuromonadales bacterium]|nr:metal ABC transporter ATP-binding protein [Desulfuromonadales bacterium]
MSVDILTAQNLSCGYDGMEVLRDISFRVQEGDYVGIVGPNGSGKSTLVKMVLGLVKHDKGSVDLFGTPQREFQDWRKVGYLPQRIKFFNHNFPGTVEEVIRLGLLSKKSFPKRFGKEDEAAVLETMEKMGIADLRHRLVGELSGGQQQRVLLARAMVNQPSLLILDEPTTALDPETRDHFYELLDDLNKKSSTTIMLITHDTWSIGNYASRFIYVDKKIIFDGTFSDFCKSEEMTIFFGEYAQHLICHQH